MVYKLHLVQKAPIWPVPAGFPLGSRLIPGLYTRALLLANKAVHREAGSIFYGLNCFDFIGLSSDKLVPFLVQIGAQNAGYIRHLIIDFPDFNFLPSGLVTFNDHTIEILANIQSRCVNLTTLTTTESSTYEMELELNGLEDDDAVTDALGLVDTSFRAIPSLREINIQSYKRGPGEHYRQTVKRLGWTVSIMKEYDSGFGRDDDDGYGDESDDDGYGDESDYEFDDDVIVSNHRFRK